MRIPARLLLHVLFVGACSAADAQPCVTFYRAHTRISGTLTRKTFPGRPQYESVATGDEPETGFYLTLAAPICGRASTNSDTAGDAALAPQDSVVLVQLLLDSAGYAALRNYLGQSVTLEGKPFSWISGHHHAPILLDVAKPVQVIR